MRHPNGPPGKLERTEWVEVVRRAINEHRGWRGSGGGQENRWEARRAIHGCSRVQVGSQEAVCPVAMSRVNGRMTIQYMVMVSDLQQAIELVIQLSWGLAELQLLWGPGELYISWGPGELQLVWKPGELQLAWRTGEL